MAKCTRTSVAGPQHPIYGFNPAFLISTLTAHNWREAAVLHRCGQEILYVWISQAAAIGDRKSRNIYLVEAWSFMTRGTRWDLEAVFPHLADALRFANGEVPGTVYAKGRCMPEADVLPEQPEQVYIKAISGPPNSRFEQ